MNEIIRQILKMDEQARQMTESAAELRLKAEASIEERRRAVKEGYREKAKARLARIEQDEQRMADDEFERMEREYAEIFAELSRWERENSEAWSERLFRHTIAAPSE